MMGTAAAMAPEAKHFEGITNRQEQRREQW